MNISELLISCMFVLVKHILHTRMTLYYRYTWGSFRGRGGDWKRNHYVACTHVVTYGHQYPLLLCRCLCWTTEFRWQLRWVPWAASPCQLHSVPWTCPALSGGRHSVGQLLGRKGRGRGRENGREGWRNEGSRRRAKIEREVAGKFCSPVASLTTAISVGEPSPDLSKT